MSLGRYAEHICWHASSTRKIWTVILNYKSTLYLLGSISRTQTLKIRHQQGDNYTHGQARQIAVHFESMPLKLSYASETPVARRSKSPMTSEMEETTREELYTMVEGALPDLVGRKIIEHFTMMSGHTLRFELTPRWYIISSSTKQPKEETLEAVRQAEV